MRLPRGSTRRIFLYAIGAGFALGLLYYGGFSQLGRIAPLAPPFALLVALGLGGVLGCCFFLAGRLALRLAAYDLRHVAAEVTGQPAHTFLAQRGDDDFAALRHTLTQTVALFPDHRLHSGIAQAIAASSADISQRFGAALTQFSHEIPLSGGVVCSYDPGQITFVPLATWSLPLLAEESMLSANEGPLRRVVRERQDVVLSGAEARLLLLLLGLKEPASLPIICLPLVVVDELIGLVLLIADGQDGVWSAQRRELARSLANQLTVAFREEQVRRRLNEDERDLHALVDLANTLTTAPTFEQALELMLRTVATLTDSEHGTLLLLDSHEEVRYRLALTQGMVVPLQLVARTVLRSGLAGWALRERRADIILDTQRDTRWLAIPGLGEMRSALVVPLLYGDRAFGVLTLAHSKPRHYGKRMLSVASALAAQASFVLAHEHLADEVERTRQSEQERQAYQSLLPHLSKNALDTLAREERLDTVAVPQRVQAVALVIELRHIDAVSTQLAPDLLFQEILQPFANAVIAAVLAHNGYLDSCDSAGALAVFGYPEPSDAAAQHGLAVAQQVQTALDELRAHWRTHLCCDVAYAIGVAAGTLIVGRMHNDNQHERYGMLGPAVKGAQQLLRLARTGEVLCNTALVASLRTTPTGNSLEPLQPIATQHGDEQPYRLVQTM